MATSVHVAIPDGFRNALLGVASDLRRLRPDYQNPERFHLAKSDVIDKVLRLAGER